MDLRQRTKRFGISVILCACLLRFFSGAGPEILWNRLKNAETFPFLTYLETGRNVRFSASLADFSHHVRESPPPWLPEAERPSFSAQDAASVEMDYDCALRPDLEELLQRPLDWDLTGEEPKVLILHTHTTESYTKTGESYQETSRYRTLDEKYNMVSIGDAVAEILADAGIAVLHDREMHDYPSYNGSYVHARATAQTILQEYPSIQLVLDLHRDAVEVGGKQLRPLTAEGDAAQLMLVVGTNVSRQAHANWEENLALALKLHVQLQRLHPGIMRPLNLRAQRFNQDLSPGAMLVEVGAAGNTRAEAMKAAKTLAQAVAALSQGVEIRAEEAR